MEANRNGFVPQEQRYRVEQRYRHISRNKWRAFYGLIASILLFISSIMMLVSSPEDWYSTLFYLGSSIIFSVVSFAIFYQRRKKHIPVEEAMKKFAVSSITGVPSIGFEEGRAYVEIEGVRFSARDKYAVGWTTDETYTVYYVDGANLPLSCEKVNEQKV